MKEWILIEAEHCPKCPEGMVQAFCRPDDKWIGGEKLRCTQDNCDLSGEIIPKGKVFDTKYNQ